MGQIKSSVIFVGSTIGKHRKVTFAYQRGLRCLIKTSDKHKINEWIREIKQLVYKFKEDIENLYLLFLYLKIKERDCDIYEKRRTDRERYEENPENGTPKYSKDAKISLEQVYDHEVIETIEANRDEDYEYELDDELELKEQPMLPETKAILFNLFRDYLANPEQKTKIIRMQNEARQKNELKKQQMYNTDIFANKPKENLIKNNNETIQIVEYKESIFKRILNKIKRFFIKKQIVYIV